MYVHSDDAAKGNASKVCLTCLFVNFFLTFLKSKFVCSFVKWLCERCIGQQRLDGKVHQHTHLLFVSEARLCLNEWVEETKSDENAANNAEYDAKINNSRYVAFDEANSERKVAQAAASQENSNASEEDDAYINVYSDKRNSVYAEFASEAYSEPVPISF